MTPVRLLQPSIVQKFWSSIEVNVTSAVLTAGMQGAPAGLFEVRVSVTLPFERSRAVGTYVAFRKFGPGKNAPPVGELQVPAVAVPPTLPFNNVFPHET